jgi:hypothetical protein
VYGADLPDLSSAETEGLNLLLYPYTCPLNVDTENFTFTSVHRKVYLFFWILFVLALKFTKYNRPIMISHHPFVCEKFIIINKQIHHLLIYTVILH